VAFTPDGAQIVSGPSDYTIKVWDLASGRLLRSLKGHISNVTAVAVTPDGAQVVSGSADHTFKVWNLVTGESKTLLQNQSTITALATDGRWLICGDTESHVWIFEWVR
jgi:WD40 repeat protein